MTISEILPLLQGVRQSGDQWSARCPAHDDRHASLTIKAGTDGRVLLRCHAGDGCKPESIVEALGLAMVDLFPAGSQQHTNGNGKHANTNGNGKPTLVAAYDYRDEAGKLLLQAVRFQPKAFRQRRPDGKGGWEWKLGDTRRVLYRLPELLAAGKDETVWICEGEKDADRLATMKLVATTAVGGAEKWRQEYGEHLKGRRVVILPDNDEAGRKHAAQVVASLTGIAASIKVIELPDLPEKGDVSDWLDQDHTLVELLELERTTAAIGKVQFEFERMSGADFFAAEFSETYLIDDVLVAGQPCIVAAPKKALKTTLCVDMFLALAAGDYFCGGKFRVPRAVHVGIMSGESGRATLQNAAKRITQSSRPGGWTAEELARQHWCFRVPRLDDAEHLGALRRFIQVDGLEVVFIDPTYLALPIGDSAGNLFAVGKLLLELSEIGQETGCTIVLVHHLRKNLVDPFIPPELEDMAWSGFAEWARQWVLIGRREKYDPEGDGEHRIWLNIGGSAGHCSLWAVDVREGRKSDQGGRRWSVQVYSASMARDAAKEAQVEERQAKKATVSEATRKANREKVLKAFKRFPEGETQSKLAAASGMNFTTFSPILGELIDSGAVEPCQVAKGKGQEYPGYKLKAGGQSDSPTNMVRQSDLSDPPHHYSDTLPYRGGVGVGVGGVGGEVG